MEYFGNSGLNWFCSYGYMFDGSALNSQLMQFIVQLFNSKLIPGWKPSNKGTICLMFKVQ